MTDVPPEVAEASRRLTEGPIVKQPPLPQVFKDIVKNDAECVAILQKGVAMSQDDWRRLRDLKHDKKTNLRPAAEKALCWNTDKGKA